MMLVDNNALEEAKKSIDAVVKKLQPEGTSLIKELTEALKDFEGETKDALMEKIGTSGTKTEGTLAFFVEEQLPGLLTALGELLDGNRETIVECDKKLADAIRQ